MNSLALNGFSKTGIIRDQLRAATHGTHEHLDALYSNFDLKVPASYLRFLKAHAQATPLCEAIVTRSGASELLPDWHRRQRTSALIEDLLELGAPAAFSDLECEPVSPAHALGMLYVLEGSRLGGAVLARRVMRSECPLAHRATRYLRHGEGERFWPTFLEALNAYPVSALAVADVLAGAERAFAIFRRAAERALTDHVPNHVGDTAPEGHAS